MTMQLEFAPGIYDISNADYHASAAVSRSQLLELKKTPYHYWYEYVAKAGIRTETPAMRLGTAMHCLILEPDRFKDAYYIAEKCDMRTTAGKLLHKTQLDAAEGRVVLSEPDYKLMQQMALGIKYNKDAMALMTDGKAEKSIYWEDKETGLMCKCRPDLWHNKIVVDLKTTRSATYKEFQSAVINGGYHIQAAMIQEGIKSVTGMDVHDFCYVVVETQAPFATAVYILDETTLMDGREAFFTLLDTLKKCQDTDVWPGYPSKTIMLPPWARYED